MSRKKDTTILLNMGGPRNFDEINTFLVNMFNDYYILNIKNSFIIDINVRNIIYLIIKEQSKKIRIRKF